MVVQLVDRHREHELVRVVVHVLVAVVADAGAVGEEVLDGDAVVDQREVVAEDRPGRRVEGEHPLLDEAHDHEGGERLAPAGDGELRVDAVGDAEARGGRGRRPARRPGRRRRRPG